MGSDHWLEVEANTRHLFVGPFIQVSTTYANPPGAARSCPNRDCAIQITIPSTEYILSLDAVVTNLVEYWTHTVYHGEEVYLGPWMPPPGNEVWINTVIPASETARAQGTSVPILTATPPPAVYATPAPAPTYTSSVTAIPGM